MTILRLFALVTAGLIAGNASTRAQDANATFVVSYIEVAPSSARTAAGILRALQDASRKEPGNSGFEVLQRKGQPQQFAILEVWKDAKAQANHAAAANTSQLRSSRFLRRQLMNVFTPALWSARPRYPVEAPSLS